MNIALLLIVLSLVISAAGIIYVGLMRNRYGARLNILFIILIFFFVGIIQNVTVFLATQPIFNKDIALILWKISIITRICSLIFLSSIHRFILEYNKIKLLTSFYFSILAGIILGLLFIPDSISITEKEGLYSFAINNYFLIVCILLFDISLIFLIWYVQLRNFPKIRKKKLGYFHSFLIVNICLVILLDSIFIVFQITIIKDLYLILYIIGAALVFIALIKTPNMFVSLTNRIYDFIVFHRSGVMLFSYKVSNSNNSILKGSILIGISHILSNFRDKKDQLNLIKMKDRDLIFEYDSNLNYALLLIVDRKTSIISSAVYKFIVKFNELNYNKLKNLNGLIDVSEFKNTKNLVIEYFSPYL